MELIKTSAELDKRQIYFLTKAQNAQKMSDVAGQTLDLEYWALYEDANSEGEIQEIFSCRTEEGEIYATNSEPFIRCIKDMLDVFEPDEIKKIQVVAGKSKNNRTFLTAVYCD